MFGDNLGRFGSPLEIAGINGLNFFLGKSCGKKVGLLFAPFRKGDIGMALQL